MLCNLGGLELFAILMREYPEAGTSSCLQICNLGALELFAISMG